MIVRERLKIVQLNRKANQNISRYFCFKHLPAATSTSFSAPSSVKAADAFSIREGYTQTAAHWTLLPSSRCCILVTSKSDMQLNGETAWGAKVKVKQLK